MAVTITDHNGHPLTLDQAASGTAATHNPDELERITTTAYWYGHNSGKDVRVFWNDRHRQWWWDATN